MKQIIMACITTQQDGNMTRQQANVISSYDTHPLKISFEYACLIIDLIRSKGILQLVCLKISI